MCYGGSVSEHETNVGAYGVWVDSENRVRSTHALPSPPTDGALCGLTCGLPSRAAARWVSNLRGLLGLMFENSVVGPLS